LPLTRSEKVAAVEALTERIQGAEAIVVTDYRGLSVDQLGQLRRQMRSTGAEFHVVKNTLTLRALAEAGMQAPGELLTGPTALAFLHDDLSGPVKALKECAKETNILAIRGALMGGAVLDAKGAEALADLPSRAQLLSQLAGILQAPQRQLVTLLQAPARDLVSVLKAQADKVAA
jgi:large subunit ribosomal protein L10